MHLMQIGYEKFFPLKLTPQEKWLKKNHVKLKPDLILALTQELNEELLGELKSAGAVTACWWGDTPANMRKQGLLVKNWDFIFIKDRFAAQKMRTLGLNTVYMPEAMNPDWHKKCYTNINSNVCFAGNAYSYRHFLIRRMLDCGVKDIVLYGSRPPRWSDPLVSRTYQHKFIVKEEKSRIFGESLACINSTSMTEGNSLNCRTFEIAGAAGLQIMEYRQAIEDCFEPGREMLSFSSVEELAELLGRYKRDVREAEEIRMAGYRRANAEHTYRHRLEKILGYVKS
jgi:spore maturation protein CgeB